MSLINAYNKRAMASVGSDGIVPGSTQNSDQRLKTNIQSLEASSSLAAINALIR
jgi:hypothetical protein